MAKGGVVRRSRPQSDDWVPVHYGAILADWFEDSNPEEFHDLVTSLHVTAETAYAKFVGVVWQRNSLPTG